MELNALERFRAVMSFEPCDRTLLWEFGYWAGTVHRWYQEGLPMAKGLPDDLVMGDVLLGEALFVPAAYDGVGEPPGWWFVADDIHDHLHLDRGMKRIPINLWMIPRIKERILEERSDTVIKVNLYGQKVRAWKDEHGHPEILEVPIKDQKDFEELKERFQPDLSQRLPPNWDQLKAEFLDRDYPLALFGVPYGLYWIAREMLGPMNLFYAFYDDPDLVKDIMGFFANFWIEVLDQAMDDLRSIGVDYVYFPEDISYKGGSMISSETFREFLMPNYKKLTSFFKDNGIVNIMMDSDGYVWDLIPLWIESGITGITPCETASGMDIVEVRKAFPRLQIVGGLSHQSVFQGPKWINEELEYKLPFMLQRGGYIPLMDHMVPPDVSWENYKYFRSTIERMAYEYGSGAVSEQ